MKAYGFDLPYLANRELTLFNTADATILAVAKAVGTLIEVQDEDEG